MTEDKINAIFSFYFFFIFFITIVHHADIGWARDKLGSFVFLVALCDAITAQLFETKKINKSTTY